MAVIVVVPARFPGSVRDAVRLLFLGGDVEGVPQVRHAALPAAGLGEVSAPRRLEREDADGIVPLAAGQRRAVQGLDADAPEERCRQQRGEACAVVEVVGAEQRPVRRRPLGEAVRMGVARVQVADLRQEAPGAKVQPEGQGDGVDERLLQLELGRAVVAPEHRRQASGEQIVHGRVQRQLGVTEPETFAPFGQRAVVGLEEAVEHDADVEIGRERRPRRQGQCRGREEAGSERSPDDHRRSVIVVLVRQAQPRDARRGVAEIEGAQDRAVDTVDLEHLPPVRVENVQSVLRAGRDDDRRRVLFPDTASATAVPVRPVPSRPSRRRGGAGRRW